MRSLLTLDGADILVAGASGGIGTATAWACAQLGASVFLTDLERPSALEEELKRAGYAARAFALDNTRRDAVDDLMARLPTFDAMADCSGLYIEGDWITDGTWEQDFDRLLGTNVLGPLNLLRACLPRMRERASGRIALVGSLAARNGGTSTSVNAAYVATKGAVHSLVRYLARVVVSDGVVVNAVAPGPILTPMTARAGARIRTDELPMGRLGDPAEIGCTMAFLCSPAVAYMTGVVLDVNGGLYM